MKNIHLIGLCALLVLSCLGCACGFPGGPCNTFSYMGPGVVDYVDGGMCAGEAVCGDCGIVTNSIGCNTCGGMGYGVGRMRGANRGQCLNRVGNGIAVVGGAALDLAAAPFVVAGKILTGGCCYETYPNCGCSNEVYYGDNCYQAHDFSDPCACGGVVNSGTVAGGGCSSCGEGGMRIEHSTIIESDPIIESQPVTPNAVMELPSQPLSMRSPPRRSVASQKVVFAHPTTTQNRIVTASATQVSSESDDPFAVRYAVMP